MRKFRVLLVVPLRNFAGTELSTVSLARGLRQAGHQVHVMCNPHPLVDDFTKEGVTVVEARMERTIWSLLKDAATMRHCLADSHIEIVHFQSAFPMIMALLSRRAIRASGVKVIWTSRGMRRASYAVAGRFFSNVADFAIANCHAEREKLVKNAFVPERVRAIYNCPNIAIPDTVPGKCAELLSELGIDTDVPVVGTASRLAPDREVSCFLEVAAAIAKEFPQTRFVIAGRGPMEKDLRQQSRDLGIEEQTLFLGWRRDMESVYSIIDVFVNPVPPLYGAAGTGNTTAEAMAMAKPVVATNVAGLPELVQDGITGLLVPPRDAPALAEATLRLLRDRDLAMQMGAAGRERILRGFTAERMVREVEAVYSEVLRGV